MKAGQKMWANNDREAQSIINAAQASGFKLLGKKEDYLIRGGFYFQGEVVTYSSRDNREYFDKHKYEEFFFPTPVELPEDSPVVSDGGSSSYYAITITNKAGETINCELGDIIRVVVGNDADLFNIIKACRRAYESSQGRGKDGVTIDYDMNKVKYFADEFRHWNKTK